VVALLVRSLSRSAGRLALALGRGWATPVKSRLVNPSYGSLAALSLHAIGDMNVAKVVESQVVRILVAWVFMLLGAAYLVGCGGGGDGGGGLPLAIVVQPANQSVLSGSSATFTVTANGATSYQWQQLNNSAWVNIAGATAASYTVPANQAVNGLEVRVSVSDGSTTLTSSAATLTVTATVVPVTIDTQPQDVSVNAGTDAVFSVVVSGTSPSLQWQTSNDGVNWTNVSGATANALILTAVAETGSGKRYRVLASNSAGSVTSGSASLTVTVEFRVVTGGDACGGGCGGDSSDGSGVGGDGGSGAGDGAGPGLSAMRNVRVTAYKPNGTILGSAPLSADYLVSLYPVTYRGPFILRFADDGSGTGEYFDESKRDWLPLNGPLHVMVPTLSHHVSANPATEAAYQWAVKQAGSEAALTAASMQQANDLVLAQLNAKLPSAYQTTDITNYVVPIDKNSGSGTLPNTWAGRYSAVVAALPIAGSLYDPQLTTPALNFTRQLVEDVKDDGLFNVSAVVPITAYDGTVANKVGVGICTAISIWGSPALPSQLAAQAAGSATPGQLTLLAGSPGGSGNCDGWGANARFNRPWGTAVDSGGNVYVADSVNNTVRKISPQGAVVTLAGSPGLQGSADGVGSAARFYCPKGVAVDASNNVYVADSNNSTIRKITPDGTVATLAGTAGSSGTADGTGAAARFGYIKSLVVDRNGNVFAAEEYQGIRRITPSGVVTTLSITGCSGNYEGIAIDAADNLYVADDRICKISPAGDGQLLPFGPSADGPLSNPRGLAVDGAGNVYVADSFQELIRKVSPSGTVTRLGGQRNTRGSADGTGSAARFRRPDGIALDATGNVYVADEENNTIRKITPAGSVSTFAGRSIDFDYVEDGTAKGARFRSPAGTVADAQGNIYVVDALNYVIRKITPAGATSILAGSPRVAGDIDGIGEAAQFSFITNTESTTSLINYDTNADTGPVPIAIDRQGNLYVADNYNDKIRKISPAGVTTTVAGSFAANGVAVDASGNVYASTDTTVRKITPQGVVSVLAGTSGQVGSIDGTGAAARFNGASGLAIDSANNIYVADRGNATIRVITPAGVVTTLAGTALQRGTNDGVGAAARFSWVDSLAVDSARNVYVADRGGSSQGSGVPPPLALTVRKITSSGVVTTVVGRPGSAGNILGPLPASLGNITSVSLATDKQLIITSDNGVFVATFP
jgi:sugar lactone lactonase YvrE